MIPKVSTFVILYADSILVLSSKTGYYYEQMAFGYASDLSNFIKNPEPSSTNQRSALHHRFNHHGHLPKETEVQQTCPSLWTRCCLSFCSVEVLRVSTSGKHSTCSEGRTLLCQCLSDLQV